MSYNDFFAMFTIIDMNTEEKILMAIGKFTGGKAIVRGVFEA